MRFEWVFFNSPNAVVWFYKKQETKNRKFKIAALSQGTAEELQKLNIYPDFIGNGNVSEIAVAFEKQLAKDEVVLFPLSNISKKSIPNLLNKKQVKCVEVYQTLTIPKKVENVDVVFFTSPSNVQGFLLKNKLPKYGVALGETTEKYLRDLGVKVRVATSYTSDSWIPYLEASFS